MPAPEPDHYATLRVAPTATAVEIRTAYRRLAREHHPDANPSPEAEARMRGINQAWETLRDAESRSLYDRQLPGRARPAARPMRAQPPPRAPNRPRPEPREQPFSPEDAPRRESGPGAEYTGDPTINWYREIGVREDAPRQEILKALSKMAGSMSGADISATEFTRRRNAMREAWAILGDQYMRAAYDRARRAQTATANPGSDRQGGRPGTPGDESHGAPNPESKIQNPNSPTPPPGYRLGPVSINGYAIDSGADLRRADLRGANLRGLDLAGIDLRDARLQGADLEAASLRKAKLRGADFSGANLRFADLSNADASAATLRQADLTGAALNATNLFRANLAGASLTEAVGPGINLDYADLARTDFTGAKITPQLIERGKLNATILPDGSQSPSAT